MNNENPTTPDPWRETGSLEERHQHLLHASKAMWTLLKSRLNLTDADLQSLLVAEAVSVQPQLTNCAVCRNPLQSTARRCLYCGTVPQIDVKTPELQAQLSRTRLTQQ